MGKKNWNFFRIITFMSPGVECWVASQHDCGRVETHKVHLKLSSLCRCNNPSWDENLTYILNVWNFFFFILGISFPQEPMSSKRMLFTNTSYYDNVWRDEIFSLKVIIFLSFESQPMFYYYTFCTAIEYKEEKITRDRKKKFSSFTFWTFWRFSFFLLRKSVCNNVKCNKWGYIYVCLWEIRAIDI